MWGPTSTHPELYFFHTFARSNKSRSVRWTIALTKKKTWFSSSWLRCSRKKVRDDTKKCEEKYTNCRLLATYWLTVGVGSDEYTPWAILLSYFCSVEQIPNGTVNSRLHEKKTLFSSSSLRCSQKNVFFASLIIMRFTVPPTKRIKTSHCPQSLWAISIGVYSSIATYFRTYNQDENEPLKKIRQVTFIFRNHLPCTWYSDVSCGWYISWVKKSYRLEVEFRLTCSI